MRLLTGPAGSGKTPRVLAEFRHKLKSGSNRIRLLVPTATLSEHLRNELARDGAVFRSRSVATLAGWIQEIAPDIRVVDSVSFHLMIEDAVTRLDRPELRKVAGMPGVHSQIARAISDLDSAGCAPANLARIRASIAPFRDAIIAVWEDVAAQMRTRRVVTRGEQLRGITAQLAANLLAGNKLAGKTTHLPLPEQIWMDGFAQLSGPEIDLVCALGARTSLTLTLPDEGVPASLKPLLLERGFIEERLGGGRTAAEIFTVPETAERECEEIARRIVEGNRSGTALRDIGVIVRQPAKYVPILRATFERFGIGAHFYFGEPLASHPSGRLLSGVVNALLREWDHAETLAALRLAPLLCESFALDQLEMKMLPRLPGGGLDALRAQTSSRLLLRVLGHLQRMDSWRAVSLRAPEWAGRLERLPAIFWPGYLADEVPRDVVEQYQSQAFGIAALIHAIQLASDWKSDQKSMRLGEFWRTVQAVMRLSTVNLPGRSRDVVHVLSAHEARQWNLSVTFVCGLVEKEFPAQTGRDPFFPDAALRSLQDQGIPVRTSVDKDEEERLLFGAACATARDLLVLTHPRTDARGQVHLPSIFLGDRVAVAANIPVRPALPSPIAQWLQPSRIRSADLLAQLVAQHKISVTSLESLLQCPFQFFAQKTLRISEPLSHPEDRLTFLLQGSIVHDVLRAWAEQRNAIDLIFHETFDRVCAEKNVQPGYRTERLRHFLLNAVRRFVNDTALPVHPSVALEQPFELPIDESLLVTGKFDRVDRVGENGAIVIDYKFSRAAGAKEKIEDETRLQGPLYAFAARTILGFDPVAMLYVSLKEGKPDYNGWGRVPDFKGKEKLTAMPLDWEASALRRVSEAVTEFRSGFIRPQPANQKPCEYCNYKDACRVADSFAVPASGTADS